MNLEYYKCTGFVKMCKIRKDLVVNEWGITKLC